APPGGHAAPQRAGATLLAAGRPTGGSEPTPATTKEGTNQSDRKLLILKLLPSSRLPSQPPRWRSRLSWRVPPWPRPSPSRSVRSRGSCDGEIFGISLPLLVVPCCPRSLLPGIIPAPLQRFCARRHT